MPSVCVRVYVVCVYACKGNLTASGISNGEDIVFRVAFKPPATIGKDQATCNFSGEEVVFAAKGAHSHTQTHTQNKHTLDTRAHPLT